tara:strand:+ start:1311 stop:1811 length:501 start_codon:yes stop_codon:yes gene_type:complete
MPRTQNSQMKNALKSEDKEYNLQKYTPYWYSDMSEEERYKYGENLPKMFVHNNIPYDYEKEAKNKGWELHIESEEAYYTHPTYNGIRFKALHYKPYDTSNEYFQYIPYVPRHQDVAGLGYILVCNTDGTSCKVKSNKWKDLFDSRMGKRMMKKKYMRENRNHNYLK